MKLRLRGNTVRLRLLKSEVARLAQGEEIRETLPTASPFSYAIRPEHVDELAVEFSDGTLLVKAPREWATNWVNSEEVGRSASGAIDILVEKDWACTTPREGEDGEGTFPNPLYGPPQEV